MRILLAGFLLSFAVSAESRCLDPQSVESIRREISIEIANADSFPLCDEDRELHRLFSTLIFLKTNPLPSLTSEFSRDHLPVDIWSYFRERVKVIVNEVPCAQGQMAFVRSHLPGRLHLCPSFYDAQFSVIERLPILIHEAHHFDGDHFPHRHCTQGRLKGMRNACDESLEAGGGYAVELETLVKLLSLPKGILSENEISRAKNMALVRAAENFNQPSTPYELRSVYLVGSDGNGYLVNPVDLSLKEVRRLDLEKARPVSRSTALNVFPRDGSDTYVVDTLNPKLSPMPPQGTISLDYNQQARPSRPLILNILNEGLFAGFVARDRVSIAFGDNPYSTEVDLTFSVRAGFTGPEAGVDDPDSLFLLDETNQMHQVRFSSGRTHKIWPVENFARDFQTFVFFGGQRWGLNREGVILWQRNGTWIPHPAFLHQRFLFLSRPFYWAPSLFGS